MSQDKTVGKVIGSTVGDGIDASIKLGGNLCSYLYSKGSSMKKAFMKGYNSDAKPKEIVIQAKEFVVEVPNVGKVKYTSDDVNSILNKVDNNQTLNKFEKLVFKAMIA